MPVGNGGGRGKKYRQIHGDDQPFDPRPWLRFPRVALFGYQFFSDKLPRGGTLLIWDKQQTWLSHGEACWVNHGKGLYIHRHRWSGANRETEHGQHYHPTQKPVAVMRWVLEKLKLKGQGTIVDPYMGAGATGVAAVQLGFNFVGVEIDAEYFQIAKRRIEEAANAPQSSANSRQSTAPAARDTA